MSISTLNKITISKGEYRRLKNLEKHFQKALGRLGHLADIKEARKEVRQGRLTEQEKIFKKLGI